MAKRQYKILRDRISRLARQVNSRLETGWQLLGQPFRTGNRIRISGDPAYPNSCDYEAEIAQAMFRETYDDALVYWDSSENKNDDSWEYENP